MLAVARDGKKYVGKPKNMYDFKVRRFKIVFMLKTEKNKLVLDTQFSCLKVGNDKGNESCIESNGKQQSNVSVHLQAVWEAVKGSDLDQVQLEKLGVVTKLKQSFRPLNV